MFALIIKDKATEDAKLKFRTFEEAAEHARLIIIPQIAAAVKQTLEQEDPSAWIEDSKDLLDLIQELYESDRGRFEEAVEGWASYAEHDNYGDMWVEFI